MPATLQDTVFMIEASFDVRSLKQFSERDRIRLINIRVNRRMQYESDPVGGDYWQTPFETLRKQTGDCEDAAIVKARMLISAGVPVQDLQFLALFGMQDAGWFGHLVVLWRGNYVLDWRDEPWYLLPYIAEFGDLYDTHGAVLQERYPASLLFPAGGLYNREIRSLEHARQASKSWLRSLLDSL